MFAGYFCQGRRIISPSLSFNPSLPRRGQTALHKAAANQRRSVCYMLVAAGANLAIQDNEGRTPKVLAMLGDDHSLATYLEGELNGRWTGGGGMSRWFMFRIESHSFINLISASLCIHVIQLEYDTVVSEWRSDLIRSLRVFVLWQRNWHKVARLWNGDQWRGGFYEHSSRWIDGYLTEIRISS